MIKNKKTNIESENKMLDKQLNTMLTSIGNNTIQNEVTSMGIVQRNNELDYLGISRDDLNDDGTDLEFLKNIGGL